MGLVCRLVVLTLLLFWFYDGSDFGFCVWICVVLVLCFWSFGFSGCRGYFRMFVLVASLFVCCVLMCCARFVGWIYRIDSL